MGKLLVSVGGADGEAAGDGGELVAGAETGRSEAAGEDGLNGGYKRGAAGEEDGVHFLGRDASVFEESIDAALDGD